MLSGRLFLSSFKKFWIFFKFHIFINKTNWIIFVCPFVSLISSSWKSANTLGNTTFPSALRPDSCSRSGTTRWDSRDCRIRSFRRTKPAGKDNKSVRLDRPACQELPEEREEDLRRCWPSAFRSTLSPFSSSFLRRPASRLFCRAFYPISWRRATLLVSRRLSMSTISFFLSSLSRPRRPLLRFRSKNILIDYI